MAHLRIKSDENAMTKKERLYFYINNLSAETTGLRRLFFIARFYWWYITDNI